METTLIGKGSLRKNKNENKIPHYPRHDQLERMLSNSFIFLPRDMENNRPGGVGRATHQKNVGRDVLASIFGRFALTQLTQTNEGRGNVAH